MWLPHHHVHLGLQDENQTFTRRPTQSVLITGVEQEVAGLRAVCWCLTS